MGLIAGNEALSEQIVTLQHKQMERERDRLEMIKLKRTLSELKVQRVDVTKYEEWNVDSICIWLRSLGNGRLTKYEQSVRRCLEKEEINGSVLSSVDEVDLKRWGVVKFSDFKFLHQQIRILVSRRDAKEVSAVATVAQAANESNSAPMAYE